MSTDPLPPSLTEWAATAQPFATPHTLRRYLAAHHTPEAALRALKATHSWRAAAIDPAFICPMCAARPGAHCFIPIGHDAAGAAIIYGCPARASEGGEVEKTIAHCVNALEKQFSAEPSGCQQWVWVVDFTGFGMTHALQARLGASFATVFRDHFPERLKAILLLNPPLLFRMLVGAIGAVADARTMAKLRVVEAEGAEAMCERLRAEQGVEDPSVLAWLGAALASPPVPGTLAPVPPGAAALQV